MAFVCCKLFAVNFQVQLRLSEPIKVKFNEAAKTKYPNVRKYARKFLSMAT